MHHRQRKETFVWKISSPCGLGLVFKVDGGCFDFPKVRMGENDLKFQSKIWTGGRKLGVALTR